MRVEKGTRDIPGVISVRADVDDKTASLELESMDVLERVRATLAEIGYPAE
jgi:copper chaperone CopZ